MKQINIKWNKSKFIFCLYISVFLIANTKIFAQRSYINELLPGTESTFQHFNLESSEITGMSHFNYETLKKEGSRFIVEKNENVKNDGEVFTRKMLWFDAISGIPKWYEETDLRKRFRITNSYTGKIIRTRLVKNDQVLEFETNLSKEKAVPFEVIIFFLRKNLHEILRTKKFSFKLFIPLLAIELEKNGLPRSMSIIDMSVEPRERVSMDTPIGVMNAQTIMVSPKSRFLRSIMPRKKTHFEFTFATVPPFHLLKFKAGKTKHVLTRLTLAK